MKYKSQEKEAERKLEGTEQNILRIDDIILELESQLGPLQEQAEKARRYITLSNELKQIEVALYLDNIKNKTKIEEIDTQFRQVEKNIQEEKYILQNKCRKTERENENLTD